MLTDKRGGSPLLPPVRNLSRQAIYYAEIDDPPVIDLCLLAVPVPWKLSAGGVL